MASSEKNLSEFSTDNLESAEDLKFGIIVSEWNEDITSALLEGCMQTLTQLKAKEENIQVVYVPGTYELPYAAKVAINKNQPDAIITLGCVIKGETKHDEYISNAVAAGLMQLSLVANTPCIFGVVTTNNKEQAIERSGGSHGNKGIESAITAVRMATIEKAIKKPNKSIGF